MPTILTIGMPPDAVLCVVFTGLLRVPPETAGQFAVIRMYGFQPSRLAASCHGQPVVDFPVGIPGETLGTDIPTDHLSRQILREHGEVGRALKYQSKQVSVCRRSGF